MRRMRLTTCGFMAVLIMCAAWATLPLASKTEAAMQEGSTQPLFRFVSSKGYRLYKTGSNVPAGLSDGPWKNEGIVAHVFLKQASGTKPVYQLTKADDYGVRFAYTGDSAEADRQKGGPADKHGIGKWMNQGPVFYVAAVQLPGTVPLYRLYLPARIVGDTSSGGFSGMEVGTDAHFYTVKASEKNHATNNGWTDEGVVGYVWKEAYPAALPDLTVQQTSADDSSVKVIYANNGTSAASHPELKVELSVYDKAGKQLFTTSKITGGVSAGSVRQVIISSGQVSLRNNRYQVKIDAGDAIKESNENNNQTALLSGPQGLKINPVSPDHVFPPAINLTDILPAANGRTTYRLAVTNADKFKAEWFQSMENVLPPNPCGNGNTNARLLARIFLIRNGAPVPTACKPLNSPQDLRVLEFTIPNKLADADRVGITVEDRASGGKYDSEAYTVGSFGVGKILLTVGCKHFLGRAGSFLCMTDQGFSTCENLRQQGKPIKCTRAGKPQP
jgi:hypothetical protein